MKKHIRRLPKIVVLLLFCLMGLASCVNSQPIKDTQELLKNLDAVLQKYDSIKLGMSSDEVTSVMGYPGVDPLAEHTPKPGEPPTPVGFLKNFDEGDFEIGVAFHNGKVIIKGFNWDTAAQLQSPAPSASTEKYDQVKIGMSVEEVGALLGSSGIIWSIKDSARPGMTMTGSGLDVEVNTFTTDYNNTTYMYRPEGANIDDLGWMLITFADGKVMMKSYNGKTVVE